MIDRSLSQIDRTLKLVDKLGDLLIKFGEEIKYAVVEIQEECSDEDTDTSE